MDGLLGAAAFGTGGGAFCAGAFAVGNGGRTTFAEMKVVFPSEPGFDSFFRIAWRQPPRQSSTPICARYSSSIFGIGKPSLSGFASYSSAFAICTAVNAVNFPTILRCG